MDRACELDRWEDPQPLRVAPLNAPGGGTGISHGFVCAMSHRCSTGKPDSTPEVPRALSKITSDFYRRVTVDREIAPYCSMRLLRHMAYILYPAQNTALNDLPNISIALGEELRRVGISTSTELARVGAEDAWLRLRTAGLHDCIHTLLALEGAVRRISWRLLPPERRMELMRFAGTAIVRISA
jgi:DNA transformation protein